MFEYLRLRHLFTSVDKSLCQENPCLNGGTCTVDGDLDEKYRYIPSVQCSCTAGYDGSKCEGKYNNGLHL